MKGSRMPPLFSVGHVAPTHGQTSLRSAVRGPPAGATCIPARASPRWHGTDPEVGFVLVDVGVGWALGVRDCPLSVPSPVGRPSAGAVSALDMVETFRPSALGFRRRKVSLRRATKSRRGAACRRKAARNFRFPPEGRRQSCAREKQLDTSASRVKMFCEPVLRAGSRKNFC